MQASFELNLGLQDHFYYRCISANQSDIYVYFFCL